MFAGHLSLHLNARDSRFNERKWAGEGSWKVVTLPLANGADDDDDDDIKQANLPSLPGKELFATCCRSKEQIFSKTTAITNPQCHVAPLMDGFCFTFVLFSASKLAKGERRKMFPGIPSR